MQLLSQFLLFGPRQGAAMCSVVAKGVATVRLKMMAQNFDR